jgi:acetylornithine aminotransferase
MTTYGRLPITFAKGEGCYLFDDQGKRYLDALSGIAVCSLGHGHPAVTAAITNQANLLHTSNLFNIERQEAAAEALCKVSGMDAVFFSNSGAEANEAAIKLARLYGNKKGFQIPTVIVMEHAFHGRTLATLTASGSRKVQAGFEPLVRGFTRAPYGDIEALHKIAKNNPDIAAVMIEPVQGEGGVHILPDGKLEEIRAVCDQYGWLMILDEVQTGNGRTGKYFAYQHTNIMPDIVTTAKGLGNGVPIGACLAHGAAAKIFGPGNHGSTFGGNPLVCAVAKAVVDTIVNDNLCDNAIVMGNAIQQGLAAALAGCAGVVEVRNKGLMIGIELKHDCADIVKRGLEAGIIVNVTSGNVVRLLPPMIITQREVDELVSTLAPIIKEFCAEMQNS